MLPFHRRSAPLYPSRQAIGHSATMAAGTAEAVFHDLHSKVQIASGPLAYPRILVLTRWTLQTLTGELAKRERNLSFARGCFEQRPPLRGGYMTQKLSHRPRWLRSGVAQLESEAQHGLGAKADFLTGAFLPDFEHGSGICDCMDGGG